MPDYIMEISACNNIEAGYAKFKRYKLTITPGGSCAKEVHRHYFYAEEPVFTCFVDYNSQDHQTKKQRL